MSVDHNHDHNHDQITACCHCAHCLTQVVEEASVEARYTIPNGPGIPTGPKVPAGPTIPSGPTIPDPPTIPTPSTAPADSEKGTGGYTGPRYHTLLRGDDWNGAAVGLPTLVQYSFATRSLSYYATPGSPTQAGFNPASSEILDANQRASIRQALALWEEASGLFFVEVPDQPELEFNGIRFSIENLDWTGIEGILGLSMPNSGTYGFNVQFHKPVYADNPFQIGTDGFYTAVHEIGHAIGLKHPFHGTPNLSDAEDNGNNTVMSYEPANNYTHLGLYDIDAVRYIYGSQEAEETAPVRWAHGPGGSLASTGDDAGNVVTGLVIVDIVHGRGGDDLIYTYGGDDVITPGAGADAVFGGAGMDILDTGVLRLQAVVALGAGKGTVSLPDGMDTFYDVETIRFLDGDLVLGASGTAGQVYRLYGAALGREPDVVGLGHWTSAVQSGALSLKGAIAGLTGSAEYTGSYASQTNAGFVTQLYSNVLARVPDAAGLAFWTEAMRGGGLSRADVLLSFSDSAEYRQKTDSAFSEGVWIANPDAVDVLCAYLAVLDRLPDAEGLAHWIVARDGGFAQSELIAAFVSSAEFQESFEGLSNREFVQQLYRTALDREADTAGLATWTHALNAGVASRTGVAFGFAASQELNAKVSALVEDGILFA